MRVSKHEILGFVAECHIVCELSSHWSRYRGRKWASRAQDENQPVTHSRELLCVTQRGLALLQCRGHAPIDT